ncbi:GNAT family N-acetyltransferase [Chitinophaga agri]|uniref:GNAT family N-acetyltransferase n=1 Tax=Chitinophaga agri TaxID=2703787 RepID=A0A6B9ZCY8_9BACT|nr:GNAT family N-acetyltransferase [Chitinophaga agri]QHS59184.1 GNAT family N-acetyltransferase [Chitinophaga agri]
MNAVTARSATLNDLPTLHQFLQALVEAERPFDKTLQEGKIYYYDLQELIESDDAEVLVLEKDGNLLACGYAHIRQAKLYLKHTRYAHLGFMFVVPEYRGKGLNQQLIAELKKWILSKGVKEVRLEVYEENTGAVKAYEKAGFSKLLTTMRCELE